MTTPEQSEPIVVMADEREELRLELLRQFKGLGAAERKRDKVKAQLKAYCAQTEELIRQRAEGERDLRTQLHVAGTACGAGTKARNRLLAEYCDRELIMARDRAQTAHNRARSWVAETRLDSKAAQNLLSKAKKTRDKRTLAAAQQQAEQVMGRLAEANQAEAEAARVLSEAQAALDAAFREACREPSAD